MIDDTSRGADGVRLADVNGDGFADLAVGWEEDGITRVYLNPGPARVTEMWPVVTVGQVGDLEDAVFADLDGDGAMDVISAAEGDTRSLFVHWAPFEPTDYLDPSRWTTAPIPASTGLKWMFALPLDIDGRNGIDIVAGAKERDAKVTWLESPASDARDLARWQLHEMSDVGWTMSLIGHDVNRDGDPDVVLTDRKDDADLRGARWLANPGTGRPSQRERWPNHFIAAQGREVMLAALDDVDRDGLADLVVPVKGADHIVFAKAGALPVGSWREIAIPYPNNVGTAKAVSIGDVDLDGTRDIVLSCENAGHGRSGVVWLSPRTGSGDPIWTVHDISGPEGIKFDLVPLVDLDDDGDLDVITTEEESFGGTGLGVIWYENPARDP